MSVVEPNLNLTASLANQMLSLAPHRKEGSEDRPLGDLRLENVEEETLQIYNYEQALFDPVSPLECDDQESVSPVDHDNEEPPILQPEVVAKEEESAFQRSREPPKLWCPFWLRKTTFAGFVLLYAILLVALVLVWHYSVIFNGFPVAKTTSQYVWTYSPTAVLVVVAGMWRQVDYHSKLLVPWTRLRGNPIGAPRSLLLDYLSPFQAVSFCRAGMLRDIPVLLTISGFALLKLITVFSTGLLTLGETAFTNSPSLMKVTTLFDDSGFNLTTYVYGSPSSTPVYEYFGHVAYGLSLPAGANGSLVYSTFQTADSLLANATLSAEVDVFVPELDCSILEVTLDPPEERIGYGFTVTYPNGVICDSWDQSIIGVSDPSYDKVPPRQLVNSFVETNCASNSTSAGDIAKYGNLYVYTVADIRYQQTPDTTNGSSTESTPYINTSVRIADLAIVGCVSSSRIVKMKVVSDSSGSSSLPQITVSDLHLAGKATLPVFANYSLLEFFQTTINAASDIDLFSLMARTQGSENQEVLLHPQRLKKAAISVFQGVTSQFVLHYFTHPSQELVTGRASFVELRLHVRSISLCLMAVGFGLLMLLATLLAFTAPRRSTPGDINTIGASAAILAASSKFGRVLQETTSSLSDGQLRQKLSEYQYQTVIANQNLRNRDFGIELVKKAESLRQKPASQNKRAQPQVAWWIPLTIKYPILVLIAVLPITTIIVLEVLQRSSDRHKGLASVSTDRYAEAYIHYIPAAIMLLIATLFNCLDFNTAMFAPFSALKRGASGRRTITSSLLGRTPPSALLEAARSRHFGAMFATIAALTGSFLTIFVSGLYSIENINIEVASRTLYRLDSFNLSWPESNFNDNGAGTVLGLIERMNLTYPKTTYDELAFPEIALGNWKTPPDSFSVASGPSYASIPAIRGNLDCKFIPNSQFNVYTQAAASIDEGSETINASYVDASFELPPDCRRGGPGFNTSILTYHHEFELALLGAVSAEGGGTPAVQVSKASNQSVFAGMQFDIVLGPGIENVTWPTKFVPTTDPSGVGDNSPGCPSLGFTFGSFHMGSKNRQLVHTMVCYQQMQRVYARVTFELNSTTIDTTIPPVVDETSVLRLENGETGRTNFEWRIQNNIGTEISVLFGTSGESISTATLDVFFQTLLEGSENVDPESLVGPKTQEIFFNVVNRFYRRYMAQAVNANMRNGCNGPVGTCDDTTSRNRRDSEGSADFGEQQASIQDGLSDLTVVLSTTRLVQNRASKLILQILLGIMLICGVLAFTLTEMRKTLKCNPCSIAGTMILLAGSSIISPPSQASCRGCGHFYEISQDLNGKHAKKCRCMIPEGAEWMNRSELRRVFDWPVYGLGWWKVGETGEKRFGIDVGRPDGLDDKPLELGKRKEGWVKAPKLSFPAIRRRYKYERQRTETA